MGGKASKVLAETTLVKCNTHGDGSKFPVICATPTDEPIEGLKGDKENCYKLGGKDVVSFKVITQLGIKLKHTRILDSDGKNRAYIISKSGLATGQTIVLKKLPNYEGQEPVDPEMLHKNGIDRDLKLYNFAKIESKKTGLSTCVAKYSIVVGKESGEDGKDEYKLLYVAEKLSSMGFHCIVRTPGGDAVATADQTGATCDTNVNVAEGVDLAAVLLTAKKTYHGDATTAGALAGAGVV